MIVLTSRPLDLSTIADRKIETMAASPARIKHQLEARSFQHAYVDGGVTIQRFLAGGCLDRLIITRVPVLIGSGVPLFGPTPGDIALFHVETRCYPGGHVQSEYTIQR